MASRRWFYCFSKSLEGDHYMILDRGIKLSKYQPFRLSPLFLHKNSRLGSLCVGCNKKPSCCLAAVSLCSAFLFIIEFWNSFTSSLQHWAAAQLELTFTTWLVKMKVKTYRGRWWREGPNEAKIKTVLDCLWSCGGELIVEGSCKVVTCRWWKRRQEVCVKVSTSLQVLSAPATSFSASDTQRKANKAGL